MPQGRSLSAEFFNRPAEEVAPALLGKALVRRRERKRTVYRITETEAYVGPHDLASHAARGRTRRTEPMFGPPGSLYIYLVYGMHWMLNVVTGEIDYPAAVLIRSVKTITGPGRLTRALGITGALNAHQASARSGLWFADLGERVVPQEIVRTPRIGVDYAGPVWAEKEYRFLISSPMSSGKHVRQV
ncbi:MAG: DNA-3-methyladenine glycosylase [Methyloceanibacter sp.]|uniref:DNA-3-methyladenine glycosylase n=1 Tax=Methyloceanibacter sp. TaxID=1965321 RepID=UPI003D9B6FBB